MGSRTPIFFIRDPILFPSYIHSQNRLPASHLKDAMVWDFISLRPESLHMQTWLFWNRGILAGYRFMNGYGSNTFSNVNAEWEDDLCEVPFHYVPRYPQYACGRRCLSCWCRPDIANPDLFEAIKGSEFPSWTLRIQTMTPEQAKKLIAIDEATQLLCRIEHLAFLHHTWYTNTFTQVRVFHRKAARDQLAENIATLLVNASEQVQERTLENFSDVDEDYAHRMKTKHSIFNFKKKATAPFNPPRKAFTPVDLSEAVKTCL
ncbi:hypothetical protein DD238_003839 [Peronospora effusa]|uniref:Catalase core domain-containing protein n=1 Tax=Peronospora effusa TaxID=542832 RepID=A0A3M6VFJ5_9STRA|nr:hypothetical protein DD238_003839 [Peronospora effusa]